MAVISLTESTQQRHSNQLHRSQKMLLSQQQAAQQGAWQQRSLLKLPELSGQHLASQAVQAGDGPCR